MNKNKTHKSKLIDIVNLNTYFFTSNGIVKAVNGMNLNVSEGEILGLVGESGSGKTMTGYSILGLIDYPGRIVSGEILFKNQNLINLDNNRLRHLRGNRISMIFQDPMMTLNPVLRIDTQMIDTVIAHQKINYSTARKMALDILEKLGVDSPDHRLKSYPHELSGGMRQRVAIGISLINKPDLIIADEPTTALDVTIQSQIIYETKKLCKEIGTAIIWITHDLAVVAGLADRVCVMYAGRDVEQGNVNDVIDNPKHPYTKGLISSIPANNKRKEPLFQINGIPPSLMDTDDSCSFYNRCNKSKIKCKTEAINNYFVNDRSYRCFYPYK